MLVADVLTMNQAGHSRSIAPRRHRHQALPDLGHHIRGDLVKGHLLRVVAGRDGVDADRDLSPRVLGREHARQVAGGGLRRVVGELWRGLASGGRI